ncbi:MAG: hypothetical protein M1454_05010 [Candidatus Thermoplasmatota archaeon]|nr:hypothetical protein [Candidatus Thermoplasmatota archaeon]MCL5731472.1 hypothetical protein [Candidatus Thermoplasmatota archaeon]
MKGRPVGNIDPYYFVIPFLVSLPILAISALLDIQSRQVNSFIFIPVVAVGALFSYEDGLSWIVIASWVIIFLCAFIPAGTVYYPLAGIIFLVSSILLFYGDQLALFDSIMVAIFFMLGVGERYFGIADVKALIALSLSFPFSYGIGYPIFSLMSYIFIPVPFLLVLNSSVLGMLFIPYVYLLNIRNGNRSGGYRLYAVKYREDLEKREPLKYKVSSYKGEKILIYRAPFTAVILLSFIIAILTGV